MLYSFSTTELHQLLKLPFLIEHFFEHKEQTQSITIWEFLSLHYAHHSDQDNDDEQDRKLPFKSHDYCGFALAIAEVPKTESPEFKNQERLLFFEPNRYQLSDEPSRSSSILDSIWQPPRIVV